MSLPEHFICQRLWWITLTEIQITLDIMRKAKFTHAPRLIKVISYPDACDLPWSIPISDWSIPVQHQSIPHGNFPALSAVNFIKQIPNGICHEPRIDRELTHRRLILYVVARYLKCKQSVKDCTNFECFLLHKVKTCDHYRTYN